MRSPDPLLAVFVLHNVEEVAHLPTDLDRVRARLERSPIDVSWLGRREMSIATALLTVLAGSVLAVADRSRGRAGDLLGLSVAGALGGNAITHLARAGAARRYNGGLLTSPLMLVAAARRVAATAGAGRLSPAQAATAVAAGNLLVPPLIVGSLSIARRITRRPDHHVRGVDR